MMRTMITTIFFFLLSTLSYAAVNAEVDRIQVSEGESFTLTLSSDGSSADKPDLSILDANFDVVGTGNSKNISIINGQMSSQTSWQIQLIPKQVGTIIIPSITMGNDKTQPITIEVAKQSSAPNVNSNNSSSNIKTDSNAFFETAVDKHETYVQEQIIYTQRFYYRPELPIADISADDLSVQGASVEELNTKGPHYQQTINGITYQVIEATYAIFPEKSGQLRIPARTLSVRMQASLFEPPRLIKLHSDENIITVLPQPNHDNPWLPAKKITAKEAWSTTPPIFKVGQSITRKITIEAEGLNQSQLPALPEVKIDGLKIYADKPETKNTVTLKGIVGTRTDSIAIVASKPGTYTLPDINIKWWNTDTNKAETVSIPAFTFTVEENANSNQTTLPAPMVDQSTNSTTPSTPTETPHQYFTNQPWLYVAGAFLVLWILTLLLWWKTARSRNKPNSTQVITQKKDIPVIEELSNACEHNDANRAREALLKWAAKHWGLPTPTLEEIALKAPSLSNEIAALDQALYSKQANAWQGGALLKLIKQLPHSSTAQQGKKNSPLNSLYPSQ